MNFKLYITTLIFSLATNFCCGATSGISGEDTLVFHHLTTQNGLSDNTVLAITQDTRGFIWMGTPNGLNRYDGREIKQYKNLPGNSNSLSSSHILSLLPENKGGLWVGTSNGLNYYNPATNFFQKIYLNPVSRKFTTMNKITCMLRDKKGQIWIGTRSGLFCKTDKGKMQFTRYLLGTKSTHYNDIKSLYEDHQQNLWIGTGNGLVRLRWTGAKKGYDNVNFMRVLSDSTVTAITQDANKRLWIGTDNGKLSYFLPKSEKFFTVTSPTWSISDLITDRKGNLWIAGPNQLTIREPLSAKTTVFRHNPNNPLTLDSEHTLSLFEDQSGSIWVGSYRGGVNISHMTDAPFRTRKSCFQNTGVTNTITANDQSELLIGTESGLCLTNSASGTGKQYSNEITGVKAAIIASDGSTWAGSSNSGLWQFSDGKVIRRFSHIPQDTASLSSEYVMCLLEDSRNRLWVGTRNGLDLLDKTTGTFIHFKKNGSNAITTEVRMLFEDSSKNLWIGSRWGLALLRPGAKVIEWFPTAPVHSIPYGKSGVACIYEDHNRRVWIGTYQYGLMHYNPLKNLLIPYKAPGLPEDVINLVEDNTGCLWIASLTSIFKLDQKSTKVKSYNFHDRIPGYEINERTAFKNKAGELFFGTNRGILQFSPDQVKDNPNPPPVFFTSLRILDRKSPAEHCEAMLQDAVENSKILVLNYWEDSFTIGFSVLNYVKPSKNRFAYKLTEFDRDWHYAEGPFATYNRLPPGEYTLLVKGTNNDGLWSKKPALLRIKVLPPWWKTWWANCIYVLGCITLLFLVIRFFWLRYLLAKEKEVHREKLDFFTNISHEMRSHLMLISAPIEKMLRSEKMTRTAHRQLTSIHRNSARMLALMKELMDFRKMESGNMQLHVKKKELVSFLKTTFYAFSELAQSRNIQSTFLSDSQQIELWFDPEQFEKTVYNLLSNAYKFTPDHGAIQMRVEEQVDTVSIHITDNGKGVSGDKLGKIFISYFQVHDPGLINTGHGLGLALAKSVVDLHKGDLHVQSTEQKPGSEGCTTFTVTMQKGNAHFNREEIVLPSEPTELVPELASLDEPIEYGRTTQAKKEKPTLLLAENHDDFRDLVEEALSENYRVISFSNGKAAYKGISTLIPDLIISDIMMPEMDGLELCKRTKSHQATSHIPIILLTAYDPETNHLKGLQQGADAYISKPFRFDILELKIRNLLATREAIQQKFSSQIFLEPGNSVTVNNTEEQFINNLFHYIEENMGNPQFSVNALCKHVGMSEPVLYKKVRALLNMTVNDFIKTIRLKKAAKLLSAGQPLAEVSASVGYADQKYFSQEFKKKYGITPGKWIHFPDQSPQQQ